MTTSTIGEVLEASSAPHVIHYVSLDVEGAEERLLETFPFDRYRVLAMTVERPSRRIHEILMKEGFVMVREHWNDGFYLQREIWSGAVVEPSFRRKQF